MQESTERPEPGAPPDRAAAASPRPPAPGRRDAIVRQLLLDRRDEGLLRRALPAREELRLPHGSLVVAAADLADADATARAMAGRVPRAVLITEPPGLPRHAAVVVPAAAPATWRHALDVAALEASARGTLVVASPPVRGLRALRAAYHHAVADAGLALAVSARGPVVMPDDLVIPRMLTLIDRTEQQALTRPIRPLLALPAEHRGAYLRTLDVLRRTGGSLSAAAAELHLHPNTVRYRVDRIEDMTGLRLGDPEHRLAIDLAVMLVVLRSGPAVAADRAFELKDALRDLRDLQDLRELLEPNTGYDKRWREAHQLAPPRPRGYTARVRRLPLGAPA